MGLKRLADDEDNEKKKRKTIELKATNIKNMESEDEDRQSKIKKYMKPMFQKLKEFLRHEKQISSF